MRTISTSVRVLRGDLRGIRRSAGNKVWLRYLSSMARSAPALIRTRSLIPADIAMKQGRYTFSPTPGTPILIDTSPPAAAAAFSGAREMYCRQVYALEPGFAIAAGDTVLDLGCNVGLFSTMAALEGARVIAIEAQSGFFPYIKSNLERNGVYDSVDVRLGLVGGTTGVLSGGPSQASHWVDSPPNLTVPQLIDDYELTTIDLIKCDIEGSEFALFSGDLGWLAIVKKIVMEVHPPYGDPASLAATFRSHGFQVELLGNDGLRVPVIQDSTGFLFAKRAI